MECLKANLQTDGGQERRSPVAPRGLLYHVRCVTWQKSVTLQAPWKWLILPVSVGKLLNYSHVSLKPVREHITGDQKCGLGGRGWKGAALLNFLLSLLFSLQAKY